MQLDHDTIVAISTPPGRGGIGIVRLSGPQARSITEPLCRLNNPLAAGRARFAKLLDDSGRELDEAVVTLFSAPNSYTSEDVVEIAAHGSPVLLEWLLRACIARGARLANPGEFTERAFLSGRLDLTQAEAVQDLIAAQTLGQARLAAAQLGGAFAQEIGPVKEGLIKLIAELEAGVDFAEDDLEVLAAGEIAERIEALRVPLVRLAGTFSAGRILRSGFSLAIVGRPNAGKSSLFNRLLHRERAIVTAEPGTTRDAITEALSLSGIPVQLTDTAGLRTAKNEAEAQGIARARTIIAEADIVLHVIDSTAISDGLHSEDSTIVAALAGRPHIVVLNKCDLVRPAMSGRQVSATTGEGLEELKQLILKEMSAPAQVGDSVLITNLRQHGAVSEAAEAMEAAGAGSSLPHEFILLDLYRALGALDGLTGATTPEDVLKLIFSSFCIGK